jgi:ribose 5-phosphate isomerase B
VRNRHGISIATNKNKGARCALAESYYSARESRIVNDANILAMGGTTTSLRMACEMIDVFFGDGVWPGPARVSR